MISEIAYDLAWAYNMTCTSIFPAKGNGDVNRYYAETSDGKKLIVTEYASRRYDGDTLDEIEEALKRQSELEKSGFPCPYIFPTKNGTFIRRINNDAYMTATLGSGTNENSETISSLQLKSLGRTCAVMHKTFSGQAIGEPPSNDKILNRLHDCCESLARNDTSKQSVAVKHIVNSITSDFFEKFNVGIVHNDFTADNILFDKNGVKSVTNFERNRCGFTLYDVGKAIISFTFENNGFNKEKIQSFGEGYSEVVRLDVSDIADALRITWCIDRAFSVFNDGHDKEQNKKYHDSLSWLEVHWHELDKKLTN